MYLSYPPQFKNNLVPSNSANYNPHHRISRMTCTLGIIYISEWREQIIKIPLSPLALIFRDFLEGEGTIFRSRIYIIIDDSDFSNENNRCDASEPALIIICQNPYSCEKILFFSRKEKKTLIILCDMQKGPRSCYGPHGLFQDVGLYWVLLGFMALVLLGLMVQPFLSHFWLQKTNFFY